VKPTRARIADAFRRHGVRSTAQRYAVLQYLLKHPTHPTVDEIHRAINRHDPRASRATVYNSLHALVDAGLAREVNLAGDASRFESHVEPHHHFLCDKCGRIEDIQWFEPAEIAQRCGVVSYAVREVILQGLCEFCRTGEKASDGDPTPKSQNS
jgi:Fe2+ or Zn2+ uptake regulation protein